MLITLNKTIQRKFIKHLKIGGDFDNLKTKTGPAQMDWAIKLLNLLSRSKFITNNLILNDSIFYPVRRMVVALRRVLSRAAS